MISILIPTYNYNVFPLVEILHRQAEKLEIEFEIIVYDDCSPNPPLKNEAIRQLHNVRYKILEKNIGRSAIRNLLAKKARYATLLFLDADTMVFRDNFLEMYLSYSKKNTGIVYGGIVYPSEKPPKKEKLRWVYGKKREALTVKERNKKPHLRFLTLNFLINKKVFKEVSFNEEIPNLRHEDTLFALETKKKGISVAHIENPVLHLGLESSIVFLQKSKEAAENLKNFVQEGKIQPEETALSFKAMQVEKWYLLKSMIIGLYCIFKKGMEQNFLSNHPSLFLFDFYRLGYYLQISKK